jgi:hypothetical protein
MTSCLNDDQRQCFGLLGLLMVLLAVMCKVAAKKHHRHAHGEAKCCVHDSHHHECHEHGPHHEPPHPHGPGDEDEPLRILERRFASGAIDEDEYRQRRQVLLGAF